jgi:hypothetical protein
MSDKEGNHFMDSSDDSSYHSENESNASENSLDRPRKDSFQQNNESKFNKKKKVISNTNNPIFQRKIN